MGPVQINQPPLVKVYTARELINTEFPDSEDWISPGILPKGAKLLLGGQAKVGKSFIMKEFARALASGVSPFGYKGFQVKQKARVLYVDMEIGARGVKKRAMQVFKEEAATTTDQIFIVSKELDLMFDTQVGLEKWYRLLDHVQPNVLILDPISFMSDYEENDNVQINKLVRTLTKITLAYESLGLSIVFSHHFGKPPRNSQQRDGWDPLDGYNFRGASKWKDQGDTVMTMDRYRELEVPREHGDAWALHTRFLVRNDSSPPEMDINFNESGDLRMRWKFDRGPLPLLKVVNKEPAKDSKPAEQTNLQFAEAEPIKK